MARDVATRVAFGEELLELGRADPRIVVLDADLANSTRVDLFAEAFPERFFEMGIAEQNMIGVAAGMALLGLTPVVSTFAVFAANRALDQIRISVAQTKAHVVIAGSYAGLLAGRPGKTHLALEDMAIFRAMPNMTIIAPGDEEETRQATRAAIAASGPIYLRLTRDPSPVISHPSYEFQIGRAVTLRQGSDVALISTGTETSRAIEAHRILAAMGISAMVVHVPTVKPLDSAAIATAARQTGAVVTAEDHSIIGGLGGAVAELLAELRPTRMARIGTRDVFGESGPNEALVSKYGLGAEDIAAAAERLVRQKEGTDAAL